MPPRAGEDPGQLAPGRARQRGHARALRASTDIVVARVTMPLRRPARLCATAGERPRPLARRGRLSPEIGSEAMTMPREPARLGEPQPVLGPPSDAAIFLVMTVNPGAETVARDLLGDVAGLQRAVGFRVPEGGLSCVAGVGSAAWDRLFGRRSTLTSSSKPASKRFA